MKVLFNLGHPAHVHLFKNLIFDLEKKGHEVLICARNKEILLHLLNLYELDYITLSTQGTSLFGIAVEMIVRDIRLLKIAKNFKPDLMIAVLDPPISHIGKLLGIPTMTFTDTEHAKLGNLMTIPFTSLIITPSCYYKNLGKKQVKYNGYHELAYLHPNYFTPNPEFLNEIGLKEEDSFIVLRFVSWGASHDIGEHGIQNKLEFVQELEKYGRVLITSESDLGPDFEKYKIKISPEKLHDLLYYANLYIGEGGTTASEAATLGTHAIHISTTAKYCGLFDILHDYGLMWTFDDENGVIELSKTLLENNNLRIIGKQKRAFLIKKTVNVTEFMIWLIDNYPKSFQIIQQDANYRWSI
jgi:hypothetical protein